MSCTLMYQPYAMSYSSSCDRPSASERQKLFKFPHVPSPPDSSHSGASSYSGHSSSASSATNLNIPLIPSASAGSSFSLSLSAAAAGHLHSPGSRGNSRRPLTPSASTSTGPSATITSASQQQHHHTQSHHPNHHRSASSTSTSVSGLGGHNNSNDLHHQNQSSSGGPSAAAGSSSSSTSTSHIHHENSHTNQGGPSGSSGSAGSSGGNGGGNSRAQYLSANCIVYENYDGDSSRIVDEHFSRALSSGYTSEKPAKTLPMQTRNFPPSFWNSAYQPPPKPLTTYGAAGADFYGSAMDYGTAIPGLTAHHHQTDPWHYPLTSHHHHHQPYHHHHRAADLAYPPMPSTSRFNAAQYGSFLFPGAAAASTAASRFGGIGGSAQCGVKGDAGHWGATGRYHPHESTWSDSELYYSAAAAHYSNMTAGLDFESHYLQSS